MKNDAEESLIRFRNELVAGQLQAEAGRELTRSFRAQRALERSRAEQEHVVLIVEDNEHIVAYLVRKVEEMGHRPVAVTTLSEAEAVIRDHMVDLVVLDHSSIDGSRLLARDLVKSHIRAAVFSGGSVESKDVYGLPVFLKPDYAHLIEWMKGQLRELR